MLILPLHRPITRANFPLATAAIVLVNLFVFVILQGGDGRAYGEVMHYYQDSGLARIESPLYRAYLAERGTAPATGDTDDLPKEIKVMLRNQQQVSDDAFRARLESGELFVDRDAYAAWQPLAAELAVLRDRVFTERHALKAQAPGLGSMLSSMFLHGGFDHLLGNMLFLIALGLLVEAPLGHGRFLALYVLGGLGAAAFWLAFSDQGSVIGASGAIAALMGAFCVLWGRRRVRFFYWFFVFFDYVKGPALALLPAWLGWELLQWAMRDDSRVAFEAHAGGILSGVLLAVAVKQLRWEKAEGYEEATESDGPDNSAFYERVRALIGSLRLDEARAVLGTANSRLGKELHYQLLDYRILQLSGQHDAAAARGLSALACPPDGSSAHDEQVRLWNEMQASRVKGLVQPGVRLIERMLARGRIDEAQTMTRAVLALDDGFDAIAPRALSLALTLHDRGAGQEAIDLLGKLCKVAPDSADATKARFLIEEWRRAP